MTTKLDWTRPTAAVAARESCNRRLIMHNKQIVDRTEKVAAYTKALVDKYLSARQKLEILHRFLNGQIATLCNNTVGAHAYNALELTLVLDLVSDICALALDSHDKAASLVNIWSQLEKADLRSALRLNAAKGCPDAQFEKQVLQHFDEQFSRCDKAIKQLSASDLAVRFKTARDKAIAHYEMKTTGTTRELFNLKEAGLTWGSPRDFLDSIDRTVWDIAMLATRSSYDEKGFQEMHYQYANDFWDRVIAK